MRWLITGGSGFIGTNLASHLTERGDQVVIIDDLSRSGSELNAAFLLEKYRLEPHRVDVSDRRQMESFFEEEQDFDAIAHLAGQVSFLASLEDPRRDFEVNAIGTLNVLEQVRLHSPETAVIGMSSNKVYGDLTQITIVEEETRYVAPDYPNGFSEDLPLEFHGPYGCSKGTADQYLSDYGRMFNLRTASLRQSSVYGPHQHPRSDQGWVAHLAEMALAGNVIQLNGVGKQVRDLLHSTDLALLIEKLVNVIEPGEGHQLNVGGGQRNSLSILEFFEWISAHSGIRVEFKTGPFRPSDQRVYVSDNSKVESMAAWQPCVSIEAGISQLIEQQS